MPSLSRSRPSKRRVRSCVLMALLMSTVAWTGAVPGAVGAVEVGGVPVLHPPLGNQPGVNVTGEDALSVPYNHSFTGGSLNYEPVWTSEGAMTQRFGMDGGLGWSGSHNGTSGIGQGGQLTLEPVSSLTTLTDFETLVDVAADWRGVGEDHEDWSVVTASHPSLINSNSTLVPDGSHMLSTLGRGGLDAEQSGCLISPSWPVPAYIANFTFSFQHRMAFSDGDAAWLEVRTDNGPWTVLDPVGGYTNNSSLVNAPTRVWSGNGSSWSSVVVDLDAQGIVYGSDFDVRFCFATDGMTGVRDGWLVDDVVVHNQGDEPGAWFHGNMTGVYANDAIAHLFLRANLSGINGQMDLEFWANWDLEGNYADNLLTSVSTNNGSTWQLISGIPGVPGNGYTSQGQYYGDETFGWVKVNHGLPANVGGHVNASEVLIRFTLQTDHRIGYGGAGTNGWEGLAIDDVAIVQQVGTSPAVRTPLANFTDPPLGQTEDPSGWLGNVSGFANEWVWSTAFGRNEGVTYRDSFEQPVTAPAGWSVEGTGLSGWEIGQTRNTSGYGPGAFHSQSNGAAINLSTAYANNIDTHLISPETTIPVNATARVSFRSWMCSEPNWDGGAVSLSTDGGETWWLLPPDVPGFHDQISTANPRSPFYLEGIIDGSNNPGGCGSNKARPFELKTFDISNLSGQTVRVRFSFFSDTYVEEDGWYIDDAGIEIDVFEPQGTWVSAALQPHEVHGYGRLDGWYDEPEGTNLSVDVLDANMTPIPGHQGQRFPLDLGINALLHPSIHLRVTLNSNNTLLTPKVHSMGLGSSMYVSPASLLAYSQVSIGSNLSSQGNLLVTSPFTVILPVFLECPSNGVRIRTYGDNMTWRMNGALLSLTGFAPDQGPAGYLNATINGRPSLSTSMVFGAMAGDSFERAIVDVHCQRPTSQVRLDLGVNPTSLVNQSSQFFGYTSEDVILSDSPNPLRGAWSSSPLTALNGSANLTYFSRETPASLANDMGTLGYRILLSNFSSSVNISVDGQLHGTFSTPSVLTVQPTSSCPHASLDSLDPLHPSDWYRCTVPFTLDGEADLTLTMLHHLPSLFGHERRLNASLLNDAKNDSFEGDTRATLDIPLHVRTAWGGITMAINASIQPIMVESVMPTLHERWLPEQTVTFSTQHTRFNPLDTAYDAPDIARISLHLSPTNSLDDAVIGIVVDRLDSTPRFIQTSGSGLASLTNLSTVSCTLNSCDVDWVLQSTWLLDDMDDLHVLTQAVDVSGLSVGPAVGVEKTAFNEIENDLEVIDLQVTDAEGRRLDDWTSPMWPYHLSSNTSLSATGQVRLQGIPGAWVGQGEAEVTLTLEAVPPRNLTGGSDEWSDSAVNWSRAWSGEVDSTGRFDLALSTPIEQEGVPSNTWLKLTPSITRRGPVDVNTSSSLDQTTVLNPVRVLHDTVHPQVGELRVLDAGRELPAEGHVWMVGQDVPLRLSIADQEGLSPPLRVWTWLEHRDDVNDNGLMEEQEYSMSILSVNKGAQAMEVDLPLVAWSEAVSAQASSGRVSVVVGGQDLAGNPMQGGGSFGADRDLATFSVQRRQDTTIPIESIHLDAHNGTLYPGQPYRFAFDVTDGNGLTSLDALRLNIVSNAEEAPCWIEFGPRFSTVTHDESCFIGQPGIEVLPLNGGSSNRVSFEFRLSWNASFNPATQQGVPSLTVLDEGLDLGLGLFRLNRWSWVASNQLDLRYINISDTTEPIGRNTSTTHWLHLNDEVHHQVGLFHRNSTLLAVDAPQNGTLVWTLSDGERSITGDVLLSPTSVTEVTLMMNENVMYHDNGTVRMVTQGMEVYGVNELEYNVVIDDRSPRLLLSSGMLDRVRSTDMNEVPVSIGIVDDTALDRTELTMHVSVYRAGELVPGSTHTVDLPLDEVNGSLHLFASTVDLNPNGVDMLRSDVLLVWFDVYDRSGRGLSGLGTESNPVSVGMEWVAFEPEITDLSATPFRPKVGDPLVVYVQVENLGALPGEVTLLMRDNEGTVLEEQHMEFNVSQQIRTVWTVDAWAEGRLGLTVELVNITPRIPVPLADVGAEEADNTAGEMAVLSLSVLAVVVALCVLLVVQFNRTQREEAYQIERIRRIVNAPQPDRGAKRLVQLHEEQ